MKTFKVAYFGLLIALAFILSFIESSIPIPIPIPGIKLGLANLVVMVALYTIGTKEALFIGAIRVVLSGLAFGGAMMMLFSLAGSLLSFTAMALMKKTKLLSMIGVSIVGGIAHNVGQTIVAMIILRNDALIYSYLPFLMIAGLLAGIVIGVLGGILIKRIGLTMK